MRDELPAGKPRRACFRRDVKISAAAISIKNVTYDYGTRRALDALDLDVAPGEVFALLGPNGSGKTTLFRLIATLIPLQQGTISVCQANVRHQAAMARANIGVVFQSPSIDLKLTVRENLLCQASLYGLREPDRSRRVRETLEQLGIADRSQDRAELLSGGLRRRLDLARGILSRPQVLLLDEPTTALDPAARSDMWKYLRSVREQTGTTVVFTTHLLEEADHADRIAIMDEGKLVVCDVPDTLKLAIGGDVLSIRATGDPLALARDIEAAFQHSIEVVDQNVRMECQHGHEWVPRLVQAFPDRIQAITMSKPTLEDVFVRHTGHRFWVETPIQTPKRRAH
ncbi:MAG: ABC transporter ATP-binding protein [Planctomycetota bacterium]|nr:ABC transporter ATP-binding protein [Planctomycetota bacterium]MDA1179741.1 ABC transporter ATP-binding protein [Planctomycetota bacterium]